MNHSSRRPDLNRYGRCISACLLLVSSWSALAQPPLTPPLTHDLSGRVVDAVDRIYPGFTEVLESHDSFALTRLAETLVASGSSDAVPVLAWILEHRPAVNPERVAMALNKVIASTRSVPVAALSRTLRRGNADQRRAAAVVLLESRDYVAAAERPGLQATLIAALSDPSVDVRMWVATSLKGLGTPAALAALAATVTGPSVTYAYYWQATGQPRAVHSAAPPVFPPPVIARLDAIVPGFVAVLESHQEPAMRTLVDALARLQTADSALVLTWILTNGSTATHGERVALLLVAHQQRTGMVPVARVTDLLRSADPDRRFAVASFFHQLFSERKPRIGAPDRAASVEALISTLADPVVDVRRVAAAALGRARASVAIPALLQSLDLADASRNYLTTAFEAVAAIGDPRAVPVLERWARTPREYELRLQAARVAVAISQAPDRGAAARRLFWEQPDTVLEGEVLSRGKEALPLAWRALSDDSPPERRAALALLGWVRDLRSIPPLLTALDSTRGALSRQQLLFDLNAILLTEAPDLRGTADIDILAAQHLARVVEDLVATPPDGSTNGPMPRCGSAIAVHPLGVSAAFRAAPGSLAASLASSPEAFDAWLEKTKDGCGIAFHPVRSSDGVARVTSTIFRPGGEILNQSWITLHRKDGPQWVMVPLPRPENRSWSLNEPNLYPAINRNYGAQDPLKIVRLDLLMESVRLRYAAHDRLRAENIDMPGEVREIDRSYLPLLERYRRSDSANVRYTAEFEVASLTGVPDVRVMIDAVEQQPDGPIRATARHFLSEYLVAQFTARGTPASPSERAELVRVTLALEGRDVPRELPKDEEITAVRRWQTFALVEVRFGQGPKAQSGYSLLFERRGGQWVFVCVARTWIS